MLYTILPNKGKILPPLFPKVWGKVAILGESPIPHFRCNPDAVFNRKNPIQKLYWKYIVWRTRTTHILCIKTTKNLQLISKMKMCHTMCRLYNFSIPHQIMKNQSFLVLYWGLWGFLEKKNLNPYSNIENIKKKIRSNISLTNTSKCHNIIYKWPEHFIEMDIN